MYGIWKYRKMALEMYRKAGNKNHIQRAFRKRVASTIARKVHLSCSMLTVNLYIQDIYIWASPLATATQSTFSECRAGTRLQQASYLSCLCQCFKYLCSSSGRFNITYCSNIAANEIKSCDSGTSSARTLNNCIKMQFMCMKERQFCFLTKGEI